MIGRSMLVVRCPNFQVMQNAVILQLGDLGESDIHPG